MARELRRIPTAYAVLRHFPSFRAAWCAAGVALPDEHWAPWTAEEDRFLLHQLGLESTVAIAAALARGEAAVRTRRPNWSLDRVQTPVAYVYTTARTNCFY
jgi:hypothetical protein